MERCNYWLPLGSGAPTVASSHFNDDGALACFKAGAGFTAPNFEKPADADKNNVYEVTITAADGNANMSTRDVKVTVTNAEEDWEGKAVSAPAAG